MSVSVKEADMEASLNALPCHFTWGIDKADIVDLKSIPKKLLDRIEFCHACRHPIYYNTLAFLSHLEGDSDKALGFLSKAEKLLRERKDDTELLVTYGNYAWVHYHASKRDRADENKAKVKVYLKKLEEIYQAHPKASENPCDLPIIHGEKGWTFLRLRANFYQRAKDSFEKALEGSPKSESFNVGYAVLLFKLNSTLKGRKPGGGKEAREAVEQLRKARVLEPDNAEVMVLLALKLQSQSTGTQERMKLVKQALRLAPDVALVTLYATMFFRREGAVEQSLEMLREALELKPTSSYLHHQVGICHWRQLMQMKEQGGSGEPNWRTPLRGRTLMDNLKAKEDECIHHFSRAVELESSNIYAHVSLAEAYAEGQQMEKATEIFFDLEKDQSLREADRQHVLCAYGLFLLYKRETEGAAVAQLKAAYQIPVQGADREQAGKKLRMLAERRDEQGQDILTFLDDQDKLERERSTTDRKAGDVDDLTGALDKGLKL